MADGKASATIIDHVANASRHGFPDEERNWSLEGKDKRAGKGKKPPSIRVCPQCFYANRAGAPQCQGCGQQFQASPREVEEVEGELIELQRRVARKDQGRAQTLEELQAIAKARGYHAGWARHVFNGRRHAS
jgi:hypothetical protein